MIAKIKLKLIILNFRINLEICISMHPKCIPHLTKPLFLFSIYYSIAVISLFRKEVVLKRLPSQKAILCKFKFRIHCKGKSCVYMLKGQAGLLRQGYYSVT